MEGVFVLHFHTDLPLPHRQNPPSGGFCLCVILSLDVAEEFEGVFEVFEDDVGDGFGLSWSDDGARAE